MIPTDRLEQATAYALGALDPAEVPAFEAELARSEELRREVDELRRVSGLLATSVPAVQPPPGLRDRILSEAHTVRPIDSARQKPAVVALPPTALPPPQSTWRVAPWLVAAAAVLGLVIMRARYTVERDTEISLAHRADSMSVALAARDSVIALLLAPDVETTKLVATGRPPSARLYWIRARNQVILAAFSLPPAPSGRTYQLWGIAGGNSKPVSLGVFNTTPGGDGRLTASVPAGLTIAVGAVTEEPAGGSPQPTSQPFLVGSIKAGQ